MDRRTTPDRREHNHYFKSVKGLDFIDVYRVLELFAVTDPCIQHAVKKLLVAGGRGAGKDISKDVKEAIDSLVRWHEMRAEQQPVEMLHAPVLQTAPFMRAGIDKCLPKLDQLRGEITLELVGRITALLESALTHGMKTRVHLQGELPRETPNGALVRGILRTLREQFPSIDCLQE